MLNTSSMKRLLLALLFVAFAKIAVAQNNEGYQRRTFDSPETERQKGFDRSKLFVGGGLGLGFGDYTNINVSPVIGYRFSNLFAAGVNVNFQYGSERYRDRFGDTYQKDQYSIFGGGVFARVYPLDFLFIQANPEYNYVKLKTTDYSQDPKMIYKDSYGAPSLLMGVGYAQPIGGSSAFTIMVSYDVLQDKNSPYLSRPIFSAGVNIGL